MMVDFPQPEWPMMQTNSPLSMPKLAFSNTVSSPSAGKRRAEFSISRKCLIMVALLPLYCTRRVAADRARSRQHADHADHQDRKITLVRSRLFHRSRR